MARSLRSAVLPGSIVMLVCSGEPGVLDPKQYSSSQPEASFWTFCLPVHCGPRRLTSQSTARRRHPPRAARVRRCLSAVSRSVPAASESAPALVCLTAHSLLHRTRKPRCQRSSSNLPAHTPRGQEVKCNVPSHRRTLSLVRSTAHSSRSIDCTSRCFLLPPSFSVFLRPPYFFSLVFFNAGGLKL